jgi:hypothetical protein
MRTTKEQRDKLLKEGYRFISFSTLDLAADCNDLEDELALCRRTLTDDYTSAMEELAGAVRLLREWKDVNNPRSKAYVYPVAATDAFLAKHKDIAP